MAQWFASLGLLGQIFLCMAAPSTVILLIQIVLSLLGFDHDGDGDFDMPPDVVDVDGGEVDISAADVADLQFFSLRSVIAFFVTFGWMGVSLVKTDLNPVWIFAIAFLCGVFVMMLVAVLMRAMYRLQSDGTADIRKAVGVSGSVYMTVPAQRGGKGKVNVMIGDTLTERDAVTDEETPLKFGEEVMVVGISGGNTLIVTRK
ncbi:MAG: hypothetical protein J6R42_05200 [Clostridia bacterium]|nr:hypothetical protein [Clostridia bacterium]